MADAAKESLAAQLPRNVEIKINRIKEGPDTAVGTASTIM